MGLSYFISFHARFAPGLAPQKPLQSFTHKGFTRKSFQTNKPLHRAAFAHKYLYTQKLVHREARSLYIEQPFHTEAFARRRFYKALLHREPFTQRTCCTQTDDDDDDDDNDDGDGDGGCFV